MKPPTENIGARWFVRQGGRVAGPLLSAQIRHRLVAGELTLDAEVSTDRRHWRPAAAVAEVVPFQFRHDPRAEQREYQLQEGRDRRLAWRTTAVAAMVLIGLLMVTLWLQEQRQITTADCRAAPAPAVQWQGCVLDGAVLANVDLGGANLSNASLVNVRLNAAGLRAADLRYANLAGADLSGADLRAANLQGANLRGANLGGADLRGAQLSFADLTAATLVGSRRQGLELSGAVWVDGRRCRAGAREDCATVPQGAAGTSSSAKDSEV